MTEPIHVDLRPSHDVELLVTALSDADEDDDRIRRVVSDPTHTAYDILFRGQRVGAAVMHWRDDESELLYIAIDAARRGQGFGTAAVAMLTDEARRRGTASLLVGTGNTGFDQIAFYQKCGFRMDGVRRDYFAYFKQPVYDRGIQIRDMLMLRMDFGAAPGRTQAASPTRDWDILLIGGASGVGKSSISYRVARHFEIGIIEVDDFQAVLGVMTTPEQQPALHFWSTHPDPGSLTAEQIAEQGVDIGRTMLPALEAVIANHLESQRPAVLEGDFILPELAVLDSYGGIPNEGRIRAVLIDEPDEAQIVANFLAREPDAGPQMTRARVSWLHNRRLKAEAERLGVVSLPSRPWETLFERLLEHLT